MMTEVVVAGHLCLDIIPQFTAGSGGRLDSYLAPGRLTTVGPATFCTGGSVSNAGINLHRLGTCTQLMGKIGDDLLGRAILDVVNSYSPDLAGGMITVPGESSSYTIVIDPPGIDRIFLHDPGANDTFGAEDVRYELLAESRLFHFGYPPLMGRMFAGDGQELVEVFQRAKKTEVTTSLDLAMPDPGGASGQANWPLILARTLPHVDLFLPSVEELLFMLRREQFDHLTTEVGAGGVLESLAVEEIISLADEVLGMGVSAVLLKMGTRGLYLRTATEMSEAGRGTPPDLSSWTSRQLWAPCFQPDVVTSTVGTGDAAIAGFLAALLRGAAPELALKVAAAAGACCVEEPGALEGVRSWVETLARIEAGWKQQPMKLEDSGWVWRSEAGVWQGPTDRTDTQSHPSDI
jgi:sugar/nucleoside kinase (ribokinase family)